MFYFLACALLEKLRFYCIQRLVIAIGTKDILSLCPCIKKNFIVHAEYFVTFSVINNLGITFFHHVLYVTMKTRHGKYSLNRINVS
jgi:hypothetical protein